MKQELNQGQSGSGFRERRIWSLRTQIGLRGNNKESSSALLIALPIVSVQEKGQTQPDFTD